MTREYLNCEGVSLNRYLKSNGEFSVGQRMTNGEGIYKNEVASVLEEKICEKKRKKKK